MQLNIKDNNPCSEVEIQPVTQRYSQRVTWMALYNAVSSNRNLHLLPHSAIYSGYSAHVAMTQYGKGDITSDIR